MTTLRSLAKLLAHAAEAEEDAAYWQAESAKWEAKYNSLLDDSVRAAQVSSDGLLRAVLAGCIVAGSKDKDTAAIKEMIK